MTLTVAAPRFKGGLLIFDLNNFVTVINEAFVLHELELVVWCVIRLGEGDHDGVVVARFLNGWRPEFHQLVAGFNVLTVFDVGDEASPLHFNRVDPDVDQERNPVIGPDPEGVTGAWEVSDDRPGHRCEDLAIGRLDGNPFTHRAVGKGWGGNAV